MRKVWLTMFTTLDGIAELPEYPPDPAAPDSPSENPIWSPLMDSIDTLFLGRVTYEAWASFWPMMKDNPDADPFFRSFSRFADRCEKVVFSRTLKTASWQNSRIVTGDLPGEVARLRKLPGRDMAVPGGPQLAQSFLEHDLVDELMLEVSPSLVGTGKSLFRVAPGPGHPDGRVPIGAAGRLDFKPVQAKVLPDGQLFLWYRRAR